MKTAILFVLCCGVAFFSAPAAPAADIVLPKPATAGGKALFAAMESRSSALQNQFPTGALSREDVSTLLWAAAGRNRAGKGWSVPVAQGRDPYCAVYLADAGGVFRYNGKDHSLAKISGENIIPGITNQIFATRAPAVLVFVIEGDRTAAFSDPVRRDSFGYILVGAMTQNVYLAADALNIGARYMATLNADFVRTKLGLKQNDIPVCIMPLGHR